MCDSGDGALPSKDVCYHQVEFSPGAVCGRCYDNEGYGEVCQGVVNCVEKSLRSAIGLPGLVVGP
jgi:hypothetical protein